MDPQNAPVVSVQPIADAPPIIHEVQVRERANQRTRAAIQAARVQQQQHVEEERQISLLEIIGAVTSLSSKEIREIVKSETTNPIRKSLLFVTSFWLSAAITRTLFVFLFIGAYIIYSAVFGRKYFKTKRDLRNYEMKVRWFQSFLCLVSTTVLLLLGNIPHTPKPRYFTGSSLSEIGSQMLKFFKDENLWRALIFLDFLILSLQMFFFSCALIFVGRTIINIYHMCSTPNYLALVVHESRAIISTLTAMYIGIGIFNYVADHTTDDQIQASFYLITLAIWLLSCVYHCAQMNRNLKILRTNDIQGCEKVQAVLLCQSVYVSLVWVGLALAHSMVWEAFSPQTKLRTFGPFHDTRLYLQNSGLSQKKTGATGSDPVLKWNSFDVLIYLVSSVVTARIMQHLSLSEDMEEVYIRMEERQRHH